MAAFEAVRAAHIAAIGALLAKRQQAVDAVNDSFREDLAALVDAFALAQTEIDLEFATEGEHR